MALINKSRKILDGKVFEVREKFKAKFIQRGFVWCKFWKFRKAENQYQLVNIHDQHGLISFDLNYNEDQNLLLNDLMKAGKIRSFDEKIRAWMKFYYSSKLSAISNQQFIIINFSKNIRQNAYCRKPKATKWKYLHHNQKRILTQVKKKSFIILTNLLIGFWCFNCFYAERNETEYTFNVIDKSGVFQQNMKT